MKLIIVESPNKCRTLKACLDDEFQVIASFGHINKIANKGKDNLGIDIDHNYKITYELMEDKVSVLQQILDMAAISDHIYIASDPDREGEAIAAAVYDRIVGFGKPIQRISFHELTKKAVLEAISKASDINKSLVAAQEARSALDKIVGYLGSRYLMTSLGSNRLSAGRVQSVVLRLLVDREKEIEGFKPETYFTIQVGLESTQVFQTKYDKKVTTQEKADQLKLFFEDPITTYTVTKVAAKTEKVNPPPPFTTSTLQQYMAKKHKFAADRTADICQILFEGGYITYHRTDSPAISEDALAMVRDWIKLNKLDHPSKSYIYKAKGENAQEAHECIRPTDINAVVVSANSDQQLVYQAIRKFFIACQLNPAIFNTLKVNIEAKNTAKETLLASGKAIKDPGFFAFLGVQDQNKIDIPNLEKGQSLKYNSIVVEKKQTKAPSRYSEANLLEVLDKMEIGRPSTTPNIIKKIVERNYSEKKNEIHHPTEKGFDVCKILTDSNFTFMDYKFTADLEKRFDLIVDGKENYFNTVDSFYKEFKTQLNGLYKDRLNIRTCGCGGVMTKRNGENGEFMGCSNYPYCRNVLKE